MNPDQNQRETYDTKIYTVDKDGILRPDFLFSYWVLVWFLVYLFLDTSSSSKSAKNTYTRWIYDHINPFIALVIALSENVLTFVYLIFLQLDVSTLLKYFIMMLLIKIGPLYYIMTYSSYRIWESILAFSVLFAIYLIYLHIQGETVSSVYERTLTAFKMGENKTPLFRLLDSIFKFFSF
jgi:hypothetical protein